MATMLTGDYRKYGDKKYLYHWDLPEGEDLVVTIDHIEYETLENKRKGTTEKKLVLHFAEDVKPLALNKKENPSRIAAALGSSKIEDWPGKQIALYVANEDRSDDGYAIRVRREAPKVEVAFCENCGSQIEPHGKYSVNKIVLLSKSKYGQALCWECSMARKEAAE